MLKTADPLGLRRVKVFQHLDLGVQSAHDRRLFGRQASEVDLRKGRHGQGCSAAAAPERCPDRPGESLRLSRGPYRQRPHPAPVQAGEQRFELGVVQAHRAVAHRRPCEALLLQPLVDHH